MTQAKCPTPEQLRCLLDGSVSREQQGEFMAHLDGCSTCRQALERLATDGRSWSALPRNLRHEPEAADAPLQDVMEQIKADRDKTVTHAGSDRGHDETLDFLQPSEKPGELGRLDEYEVQAVMGRGGMGVVLRAFEPSLNRVVAIKVMAPQLAATANARRRFRREAEAMAAVRDEHVISIHAIGETNGGLPYFVMELIQGLSLQDRLDRGGALELKEILRIGLQTARGLAAAHAAGLVHRDIKPANILLENGVQRVKLTDFGLARAVDDASLTQSGVIAGTPHFMSPEQARGEAVDARSDLFSLGGVLYAMCAGRPPFRAGNTPALLRRVCDDTPRPIREINPEIPDWLCAIIEKLMAKNPADRFASAKEVANLLEQHLAHLQQPNLVPRPAAAFTPPAGPQSESTASDVMRRQSLLRAVLLMLTPIAVVPVIIAATSLGGTGGEILLILAAAAGIAGNITGLVLFILRVRSRSGEHQKPIRPRRVFRWGAVLLLGIGLPILLVPVFLLAEKLHAGAGTWVGLGVVAVGLLVLLIMAVVRLLSEPEHALASSPVTGANRPRSLARFVLIAGAALLLGAGGVAGWFVYHWTGSPKYDSGLSVETADHSIFVEISDDKGKMVPAKSLGGRNEMRVQEWSLPEGQYYLNAHKTGTGLSTNMFRPIWLQKNRTLRLEVSFDSDWHVREIQDGESQAGRFIPLFSGHDLTGWKPVGDLRSSVSNGIMRSLQMGQLRTEKAFENYVLRFQYRYPEPPLPNEHLHVYLHMQPDPPRPTKLIIVELYPSGKGRIWPDVGAKATQANIEGKMHSRYEWNEVVVTSRDGRLEVALNGEMIGHVTDCDPRRGYIGLVSMAAVAEFRNIEIREFPSTVPPQSIARQQHLEGSWVPITAEMQSKALSAQFMRKYLPSELIISGDHWGSIVDGKQHEGGLRLDPWNNPGWIDFTGVIFQEAAAHGIYEVEGDTLRLCLASVNEPRPQKFATNSLGNQVLITYRRKGATALTQDQPWTPLFNGQDLTGWRPVGGLSTRVANGVLTSKYLGRLQSEKEYENYVLAIEYRYPKPRNWDDALNLFLHMETLPAPFTKTVIVKLDLDGMGKMYPEFGAKGGTAALQGKTKPRGEWNRVEVTARGDTVEIALNGEILGKVVGCEPHRGFIGFDSEASELEVRKIEIKELPAGRAEEKP
jgi:uncharacterized protein (TIGR03067 family)